MDTPYEKNIGWRNQTQWGSEQRTSLVFRTWGFAPSLNGLLYRCPVRGSGIQITIWLTDWFPDRHLPGTMVAGI